MDCAKNITVAFSGHRTYAGEACDELREMVVRLYNEGYRRFLCGMAWGFDLTGRPVGISSESLQAAFFVP